MQRTAFKIILSGAAMALLLSTGGCKQQQQMAQQIEQMDAKMGDSQKRMTALDTELKKASFEIQQMKALVTKLGNVVVDLQKAEEDRKAAEAARAAAAAKKGPARKAPAKAGAKHH